MRYCSVLEIKNSVKYEFLKNVLSDEVIANLDEITEEELKIKEETKLIDEVVSSCIDDAISEINGYLLKKYNVNILQNNKTISKFCKDISIYNIASRCGIDEDTRENNYYKRYQSAIKFLENVSKGIIEIGFNEDSLTVKNTGINIKSSKRLFNRNSLGGM